MEASLTNSSETKIVKRTHILRRYFFFIFGILFLLLFTFNLFLEEWDYVSIGYLLIGAGYFTLHFHYKKKNGLNESYISWDAEKIVLRELPQPASIYKWEEVDAVKVSKNHLTIKSGDANGIMFELKGYKKEDVELLEVMASNFSK